MRQISIQVYGIKELEGKAKEKALKTVYDMDPFCDDAFLADAEGVGIVIDDYNCYLKKCRIRFKREHSVVASRIIKAWYVEDEAVKISREFLKHLHENKDDNLIGEICGQFHRDLEDYFMKSLVKEFEYSTSKEGMIEIADNNDYEFFKDGTLFCEPK